MKKIVSLILSACILFCTVMVSADNVSQIIGSGNTVIFIDVPDNYWARNEIQSFASRNIISGNGDGTFEPDAGVTREQFCKMLVLTFNAALSTPSAPSFSDVDPSRWSYPYVEACKEFLTGYMNPFGGLPAFHPEEYATREDIAVALVRMMGLTDSDANGKDYAIWKFKDGIFISPNLIPYVSIACERGLISGYPDGTFRPTQGITRAETVVLLNRATKQAVTNINAELNLSANVEYSKDGQTATIWIEAEEGTTVTVNGEKVFMDRDGYGSYTYFFEGEESKLFAIEGKKGGKTKTVNVTAKYEIGAPVLNITNCPTNVTSKNITISGTMYDKNYPQTLTINGESVAYNSSSDFTRSWSASYTLEEGDNTFEIVLTNSAGKTVRETRTVNFSVGGPVLKITQCPTNVTSKNITISGTMYDKNYPQSLTINGENVAYNSSSDYTRNWSVSYTLEEGENTFEIVLTNSAGKTVRETRTVNFSVGNPVLKITQCPTNVTSKNITISGTMYDKNYPQTLTINGETVAYNSSSDYTRSWSASYVLKEGDNTFEIVLTNSAGKTVRETRTVNFSVGGPVLKITQCPTNVTSKNITISGTMYDKNYPQTLTINGENVAYNSSSDYTRSWSASYTLKEGDNTFEIVLTNSAGKTVKETRTVNFSVGSPEIIFTNCPEVTQQKNISIQGKIKGFNEGVKLYINDQEVSVGYSGDFSKSVTLNEGDNGFVFRAVNSYGKSTSIAKTIRYVAEIKAPALKVEDIPLSTTQNTITISGTVNDSLDSKVNVYVNDKKITSGNGSWTATVNLNEGSNDIIIVATNSYGKSTTVVKKVTYTASDVTNDNE